MKYLCLVYYEEKIMNALPQSELNYLVEECLSFGNEVRLSGHFVGGEALQSVDAATTVRLRNSKVTCNRRSFRRNQRAAGRILLARSPRP